MIVYYSTISYICYRKAFSILEIRDIFMYNVVIPLVATVISGIFTASVFRQYLERKKPHQLIWTIGLVLFTLSTAFEFHSEAFGWYIRTYQLYYVCAASLVAWLGAGTVYLLGSRRSGHIFLGYVLIVTLTMLIYTLSSEVIVDNLVSGQIIAGSAMPSDVRLFSPLLTIPGAIALIGGALYSWYKTKTNYNLLIGVGALIVASGGSLARFGIEDLIYITELIGVFVMLVGFIRSAEVVKKGASL